MAPAQKTADILLRYKVDRASLNSVSRATNSIEGDIESLRNATLDADVGYRKLEGDTYELVRATDSWADNLDDLRRSLDATTESAEGLGRAGNNIEVAASTSRGSTGGSRGGGITGGIDRFGRFGTQIAGGLGGGELGNSVGLVGDLADAIGTLGPVGIAATGAIAGLTIGIQLLNTQTKDAQQTFNSALDAQSIYYDAVRNLTSSAVRDELIPQLQRDNDVLAMQLAEGRGVLESNFSQAGLTLTNVASALGVSAATDINEFRAQLDLLETQIGTNDQAIGRLKTGLEIGAFAYNDNIEAQKEYLRIFGELAAAQAAVMEASERYAQQLAYDQKKALEAVTEASARYADQLNYEAKQAALRNEETAREDYVKSIADEAKLAADAADAHQKYRDGLGETAEQLAEAETERQLALSDIQDDYQREAVEAAEDLNDELVKITRDASDQLQDAVADRDALAFVQAKRQRDKDLQDAKANDEKESRRRQQEFQREYNEEVRASNIRYQHLLQSERRETETRYQAYQTSLQQLAQASGQKLNLEQQYNNATLAAAGNFANSLRATYLSAFPTKGTIPTKGGGGKTLTIDFRGAQMPAFIAASKQQVFTELGNILSQQYGVK